jgi:hypothetical protein
MSEANKDLFTLFMNSWSEYVNAWSIMYNESIRNTSMLAENWLEAFLKFWSGQYKDKVKVE